MSHLIATLKPGRDVPIRAGHPWVFSQAMLSCPDVEPGTLVEVRSHAGAALGIGYVNPRTNIRIRMLDADPTAKIDAAWFARRFVSLRWKVDMLPPGTDGYRLAHAESDGLPGLIVDVYADVVVFQISTAGMERLRAEIIEGVKTAINPSAIVERSDVEVRKMEGLTDLPVTVHFGEVSDPIRFVETGLSFEADPLKGQKTGFFLDQRPARMAVGKLARGRRVLNLFGYTGAFSVHAAANGAEFVATVDVSRSALEGAERAFRMNGFDADDASKFLFLEADIFELLTEREIPGAPYDLIICDPPALAKTEAHLPKAMRAYTWLNRACLERLSPGGLLVTSSCSGRVELDAFREMLRHAAGQAKRDVHVLEWIQQPIDHSERLAFSEGRYLKTAVLRVI